MNNGFENLNKSDIVNLINSDSERLTVEEQLESDHNIEDTEMVTPTPKELTSKQFNHFEQRTRILLQFDPN